MRQVSNQQVRWGVVSVLFMLALFVRGFRGWQEEIANPDAIRYVDQAQGLSTHFVETLKSEVYHPLHAGLAVMVHKAIVGLGMGNLAGGDRMDWLWSLRMVGIVMGAFVTLEIVALARLLGAPFWAAVVAALTFLLGRRTSVHGADGLSDMTALAFFGAAMIVGLHALRFGIRGPWLKVQIWRPWVRWGVAGFLAGMGYLARPEGMAAVVILGVILSLLSVAQRAAVGERAQRWQRRMGKIFPRRRLRLTYAAAALACLLGGAAIPAVPYMLITHRVTGKVDVAAVTETVEVAQSVSVSPSVVPTILRETFETFSWPAAVLLFGAILLKPRLWGRPRMRVPVIVWSAVWISVMTALLLWPGKRYLDGRHTLPLQLLLFSLLGLALAAWERPMHWWMNWWRRSPEKWRALPAWRRWSGWPRLFAAGIGVLVLLVPGIVQLAVQPRADKAHFMEAAQWIDQNAADGVVVVDYQRLVGFYSRHPFAKWFGTPEKPELGQLDEIRRGAGGAPLIIGMAFESAVGAGGGLGMGQVPQLVIGPYRAIAAFQSPTVHAAAALQRDVYVLYALPGEKVMRDGEAPALTTLPGLLPSSK